MVNGDGWDDQCTIEAGFSWINTPLNNPESVWTEICGDGKLYLPGNWDDGNTNSGDGWSSTWSVEAGWTWSGGSFTSPDTWQEICGDGSKYTINIQEWDDGNFIIGDGWDSNCLVENGWEWTNSIGSISVCIAKSEQKTSNEALTTQALVGATVVASVVSGVTNLSSPTGLWQMMNLVQLVMLIVLLNIYLPKKVIDVLNANSCLSFSFKVPFIEKIFHLDSSLEYLDSSDSKSKYEIFGIYSESALLNILSFIILLTITGLIHLWFIPCKNLGAGHNLTKKCKLIRLVARRIWVIFTFGLYIRLIIQSYQYLTIISISGMYYMDISNLPRLVSWITSFSIAAFWILTLAAGTYIWRKCSSSNFQEIFSGLKMTPVARSYQLLLMLRRLILISWMIWMKFITPLLYLSFPGFYQLIHLWTIIFIRPFSRIKDNIIEVFNELVFTIILWSVVFLNKKEKWDSITVDAFFYLLMAPGAFMFIVVISK
jgi:cysteine-rich repeat protein